MLRLKLIRVSKICPWSQRVCETFWTISSHSKWPKIPYGITRHFDCWQNRVIDPAVTEFSGINTRWIKLVHPLNLTRRHGSKPLKMCKPKSRGFGIFRDLTKRIVNIMRPSGTYKQQWTGFAYWFNSSPLDKMAAISLTIFSDAFPRMKYIVFWSQFYWSLFLRVH